MNSPRQETVVIGAGVIGCAAAYRLASAGRSVLLVDRAEPGVGGASYGNAGRIAVELVEPIPSIELLFGFWHDLFMFGGSLDLPPRRLLPFAPWAARFAAAAFRRRANTAALTPIVRTAADRWAGLLREIGRTDLIARTGHYHFWTGDAAAAKAAANARLFEGLGVGSEPASGRVLSTLNCMARTVSAAGLWFPDSAHILDPAQLCAALAQAAVARGAVFRRAEVGGLMPREDGAIEIVIAGERKRADEVVVCAGAHSTAMLAPFGLRAPLEAARGYHIELPGCVDHFGASAIFMDSHLAVTPMNGRVRASSFLDFVEVDAPADARKTERLIRDVRALGYDCDGVRSWFGARSMLPDSLPGIGRAPTPHRLFYAIGGQMIGLTIAAATADMIRDLVVRGEAEDATAFDLARFA